MELTAANYQVYEKMISSASNMLLDFSKIESTFRMEHSESTLL